MAGPMLLSDRFILPFWIALLAGGNRRALAEVGCPSDHFERSRFEAWYLQIL